MTIEGNRDYHAGIAVGFAYALAQNNLDQPIMGPITIPLDHSDFDLKTFEDVFSETLNAEAHCFELHTEARGSWLYLWVACTENSTALPNDWQHLVNPPMFNPGDRPT